MVVDGEPVDVQGVEADDVVVAHEADLASTSMTGFCWASQALPLPHHQSGRESGEALARALRRD